jgi:5-formyltetrahydrofolate cyclo-ligase
MDTDKSSLRQKYKEIRLNMDRAEVEKKSQLICRRLLKEVDWASIKNLSAFQPITKLNEVDIKPLLADLRQDYPEIKITLLGQTTAEDIPQEKFDFILVPVLAFDKHNYRLGWGSGFYDQFLAEQPQSLKTGICFANGFVAGDLPHELHDIPLDKIVTEV